MLRRAAVGTASVLVGALGGVAVASNWRWLRDMAAVTGSTTDGPRLERVEVPIASVFEAPEPKYPDFEDEIPRGYRGPVFELSQDYPSALPADVRPWEAINFKTNPMRYLSAVKSYVMEGQLETDWRGFDNPVRKWYHTPWLHKGTLGREFIHGMTRERTSLPGELGEKQTMRVQNWAVGLYNPAGGFTIGLSRAWIRCS